MDSRRIKKFIAKEGLIILGTIGLGFFFQTLGTNLLPSLQVAIQQSHGRFIPDGTPAPKTYTDTNLQEVPQDQVSNIKWDNSPNPPTNDGPWTKYQTDANSGGGDATATPAPSGWMPNGAVEVTAQPKSLTDADMALNKVMICLGQLLIILYPISWLIRFIIWAIKTLELQKFFTVRIKKTIAREVLILLGIILLGGILFKTGEIGFKYFFKDYYWQEIVVPKKEYAVLSEQDKQEAHKQYENEFKPDISWSLKHRDPETFFWSILVVLGKWILFLGYPIYLLFRFIAWTIRTLKEKP